MKKMTFFAAMFLIAAALTSCGASKPVAQQPVQQRPATTPDYGLGTEIPNLPCVDESMDDSAYFREMGTATHINMQSARSAALQAAKSMIYEKLGGYVEGLTNTYVQSLAGSKPSEEVGRVMRTRMDQVVQEELNHAQKVCEKMFNKGAEGYTSFIAIQIPVKKMVDAMVKGLSEEEKLRLLFDEEEFRKYSDEQIQKMLEHKANYRK
jgi:hypothetical protein